MKNLKVIWSDKLTKEVADANCIYIDDGAEPVWSEELTEEVADANCLEI